VTIVHKKPHTVLWWTKFITLQNMVQILIGTFFVGGTWAIYIYKIDATELRVTDIQARVSVIEKVQEDRHNLYTKLASNQENIIKQVDLIDSKLDRRDELLDERLDKITRLLVKSDGD
jgi:hypothetical protein